MTNLQDKKDLKFKDFTIKALDELADRCGVVYRGSGNQEVVSLFNNNLGIDRVITLIIKRYLRIYRDRGLRTAILDITKNLHRSSSSKILTMLKEYHIKRSMVNDEIIKILIDVCRGGHFVDGSIREFHGVLEQLGDYEGMTSYTEYKNKSVGVDYEEDCEQAYNDLLAHRVYVCLVFSELLSKYRHEGEED